VLHIKTPYLYKRGSTYYYARRVPSDLLGCYSTNKIVISLRTRIKRAALLSASHLTVGCKRHQARGQKRQEFIVH